MKDLPITEDWKYVYEDYCDWKDFVRHHVHVLQEFVFRRVSNPGYLHFRKLVEFTTSPPVSRE